MISSDEMVKHGTEYEIQKLKREKDLLMDEVVQLRQEHVMTVQQIDALSKRMQSSDLRQKEMVSFLAKVLQNQVFFDHFKKVKEKREIVPMRVRRKFLKQHRQPRQSESDELLGQQIVKYRMDSSVSLLSGVEHGKDSTMSLDSYEHNGNHRVPDYPSQDLVDKVAFDTGEQDTIRDSVEAIDTESNNLLNSQADIGFADTDYLISLPNDATPEAMVLDDCLTLAGESIDRPDSGTSAFNRENVMNFEMDAGGDGIAYLTALPDDMSKERMFQDVAEPAGDFANEVGFWNIDVESGRSSPARIIDVWNDICLVDDQETELADASCSLWDLGLHTVEEALDINKYVGGEFSFQEHKDDDGQQIDSARKLEA